MVVIASLCKRVESREGGKKLKDRRGARGGGEAEGVQTRRGETIREGQQAREGKVVIR